VGVGSVFTEGVAVFTTNISFTEGMSPLVIVICENARPHSSINAIKSILVFMLRY
jgi:hypothetical protein